MIRLEDVSDNAFGRTSYVRCSVAHNDRGESYVKDLAFTAPYKIMAPFHRPNGCIQLMLMSASAGIMAGDRQEFDFTIESGAQVEYISQAYEKIHQMVEGEAIRKTRVHVDSHAKLLFNPQTTIPFKDSSYTNYMDIYLKDDSSCFFMSEILSCGRAARDEKFQYTKYHNLVHIYRGKELIYRDNSRFAPSRYDMTGFGMYEGYSHMGTIFLSKSLLKDDSVAEESFLALLEKVSDLEGGFTRTAWGDYVVRLFAHRAQILETFVEDVISTFNLR